MSAFILCTGAARPDTASNIRTRLAGVGVAMEPLAEGEHGRLLFHRGANEPSPCHVFFDGGEFILRTGGFFYRDLSGTDALAAFFREFDPSRPNLDQTVGQFCLAIKKNDRMVLLTDRLGTNKIYHDENKSTFSTLFIGIAEGGESTRVDPQGCYEYAWNGATFAERTFLRGVATVPFAHAVVLPFEASPFRALPAMDLGDAEAVGETGDRLLDRHIGQARGLFSRYADWFGDRINLSFSGGFDSRLMLALLLDAGIRPRMFVYGSEEDQECRIARTVAEGEGLKCEVVDKSKAATIPVEDYREHLNRTYGQFDGWKNTGLFDTGADGPDRARRVAGGMVKMNGSVGEIYRNFFYLPDRPYSPREIVWSFYSQYDPKACTPAFDAREYDTSVAAAIGRAIGAESRRLDRRQVELAYPLFRARYWTAREMPSNQAFGPMLVPFMEPSLIKGTCEIPLALKNHGIFEGRMIRRLNPRLASYESDYGFSFAADTPLGYRFKMQFSQRRPPILRRYSYRVQNRRSRQRPYFLEEPYLRAVLDPDFPFMRRFFRVESIHDPEVLNRVATMEFVCQRIQARLD